MNEIKDETDDGFPVSEKVNELGPFAWFKALNTGVQKTFIVMMGIVLCVACASMRSCVTTGAQEHTKRHEANLELHKKVVESRRQGG